jgi:hypothetical protein
LGVELSADGLGAINMPPVSRRINSLKQIVIRISLNLAAKAEFSTCLPPCIHNCTSFLTNNLIVPMPGVSVDWFSHWKKEKRKLLGQGTD